ncbi:hypothetical protein [Embleya sp. AB8]|uniref:hypothetical protein n=1 Tax=Embleya sp. AB8 TaxID=3156304 RepID=UPI003C74CC4E
MEIPPTELLRRVTEAREAAQHRVLDPDEEPFHTSIVRTPVVQEVREPETQAGPDEGDPPEAPDTAPDPPAPGKLARGSLIPDWRHGPQDDLTELVAPAEQDAADDQDQDLPDDPTNYDDHLEVDDDGKEEPTRAYPGRRSRARRGAPQRVYRRPPYLDQPFNPRQSGIQWWAQLGHTRQHFLYNAAAFTGGVMLDFPQFVSRQAVYLVATYDGPNPNHVVWSVVVAGAVWLNWRTRRLWPPLALLGRVPVVSLVMGLLLYGPRVVALDKLREFLLLLPSPSWF